MSFSRRHRSNRQNSTFDLHLYADSNPSIDDSRRRKLPSTNNGSCAAEAGPSKRRRSGLSASAWQQDGNLYFPPNRVIPSGGVGGGYGFGDGATSSGNSFFYPSAGSCVNRFAGMFGKSCESVKLAEDEDPVFMSRDEIERSSPSRKDGIDVLREMHLRHSYCAFLQDLGLRLELPQTTIGTAMVICHRFFVRRSHACHDRFLIATAALFLAAKSEETPCPLNDVVRASAEILHKQNVTLFPYLLPIDWFEKYRERVTDAEQLILTTLDFELNVQHPYTPLMSVLNKLGLTQTVLVNVAWNLINEGLRSSLWLQFKPHHIAAGATFLAAQFLNFDLGAYQNIWQEFKTAPSIVRDVVPQLMELL